MIVVVPVDPPRDGLVLSSLVDETPLSPSDATHLYEVATMDVLRAVAQSGGELLVNYRDEETLPDVEAGANTDPEAEVRALVADALGGTDDVRFERQVGSNRSARVGNTVSHLLNREEHASVGVLEPTAPLVTRTDIDGAAMAIRRNDVVLGPTTGGQVYVACFSEPIDFTDAYTTPELSTLARRGDAADVGVGLAPMVPTIENEMGLCSTIAGLETRQIAERAYPEGVASVVADLGLAVEEGPELVLE